MSPRQLSGYKLRQAALAAEALLRIDAARSYGLVKGGPEVVVERCEGVIAEAREAGLTWSHEEIDGAIAGFLTTWMADDESAPTPFDRELTDEETRPTRRWDGSS